MSISRTVSKVRTLQRAQNAKLKERKSPRATSATSISASLKKHWKPHPGPQAEFFESEVHELCFGGAAGGGKSAAVIATALKWIHVPEYRALILRRETTQLNHLLDESLALYRKVDPRAELNRSSNTWTFSSGAQIRFAHCRDENDAFNIQGHEYQFIAFDELTHFFTTPKQYLELCSRIRSRIAELPRYIRCTTNPGGIGHEWVFKRFGPWLDPEYVIEGREPRYDAEGNKLPPALPGEILWLITDRSGREKIVPAKSKGALSRTFIPARLADNPTLMKNDPDYEHSLYRMDPVRREQLLNGNWLVKPAAGLYFKREWFQLVDAAPADARRIRYWDRAASEGSGDWTRGIKLALKDGILYVEHVASTRSRPAGVEKLVLQTAELDGRNVMIGIEKDPGQAGVFEADSYVKLLAGFNVRTFPVTKDKITRAQPVSAQAEAGNVKIVRGSWNDAFLDELEAFPDGDHDDFVDALSGGAAALYRAAQPPTFKGLPSISLPFRGF